MRLSTSLALFLAVPGSAIAQGGTWQPLANPTPFQASTALLLTDGTVMSQDNESNRWWRLTPDVSGDYVGGTWSPVASMNPAYGPLYFASAVLGDGRVVVVGGEYNISGGPVWTNRGAIYDPLTDSWSDLAPPQGWTQIGDAQSTVLADGRWMLAHPFDEQIAILDPTTLTYTVLNPPKDDRNDEEGWTLLPDGSVLTVDALAAPNSQRYLPATNEWVAAGSTIVRLEDPGSQELGPAVLRPDGTVFAIGATPHTAIYDTVSGSWTPGPDFPGSFDIADGPAALLPNGNVLMAASPGVFRPPIQFFEFDGTNLFQVPNVPRAPSEPSYFGRMLVLPTGQILWTDGSSDVEVYTPLGTFRDEWRPSITNAPATVRPGDSYSLMGRQLNGLSQGAEYGDDAQSATNYPLVRITNTDTGDVFYARTHDHSSMGVATGDLPVSTSFDVPAGVEMGPSTLTVVANGIPSFDAQIVVSSCAADVTPQLDIQASEIGSDLTQTITLTNVSGGAMPGPITLVLDTLGPSNAMLINATDATACAAPIERQTIDVSAGSLGAGRSVSVTLRFSNPNGVDISYTPRVLAGAGDR